MSSGENKVFLNSIIGLVNFFIIKQVIFILLNLIDLYVLANE